MRIKINNREIELKQNEVKAAKRIVAKFLGKIREITWNAGHPTFYFTFLIVMHLMSQEALDNMDPDILKRIMEGFSQKQ